MAGLKDIFLFPVVILYVLYLGHKYFSKEIKNINTSEISTKENNDVIFILIIIWLFILFGIFMFYVGYSLALITYR